MDNNIEEKNYCTLYLVRHGETEFNTKNLVQGHVDSPLTEKGINQAKDKGEEFKNITFDAVFASDLSRAINTAEIIKLDRELVIESSEMLREKNYGRFDGRHSSIFSSAIKEKLAQIEKLTEEQVWTFKVDDNEESYEEALSRFILKLREISLAYLGKTVLVVSHGGVLRNFLIKMGYGTRAELPSGTFKNAGHIEVLSDGVDFFIKKVQGIEKLTL